MNDDYKKALPPSVRSRHEKHQLKRLVYSGGRLIYSGGKLVYLGSQNRTRLFIPNRNSLKLRQRVISIGF